MHLMFMSFSKTESISLQSAPFWLKKFLPVLKWPYYNEHITIIITNIESKLLLLLPSHWDYILPLLILLLLPQFFNYLLLLLSLLSITITPCLTDIHISCESLKKYFSSARICVLQLQLYFYRALVIRIHRKAKTLVQSEPFSGLTSKIRDSYLNLYSSYW